MNKQVSEYIAKGYARGVPTKELKIALWYLPIVPFTKASKLKKVRRVCHAATSVTDIY